MNLKVGTVGEFRQVSIEVVRMPSITCISNYVGMQIYRCTAPLEMFYTFITVNNTTVEPPSARTSSRVRVLYRYRAYNFDRSVRTVYCCCAFAFDAIYCLQMRTTVRGNYAGCARKLSDFMSHRTRGN